MAGWGGLGQGAMRSFFVVLDFELSFLLFLVVVVAVVLTLLSFLGI